MKTTRPSPSRTTPSREELLAVVRRELHDVNPDIPADLVADQRLITDLGVDSLDLIEFVARVEYDYDFIVPDEDLDGLDTLDAIVDYMQGAIDAAR